jgi:ABC-type phosphate transport system ATPase subunit
LTPQVNALTKGVNNIVALIGATGTGKSTLTCYLKKADLSFDKKGGGKYLIKYAENIKGLPLIGHT